MCEYSIWSGYGMEMDSYKSQISDGVMMGLAGTKMKSYKPVSQIACASVSFFLY